MKKKIVTLITMGMILVLLGACTSQKSTEDTGRSSIMDSVLDDIGANDAVSNDNSDIKDAEDPKEGIAEDDTPAAEDDSSQDAGSEKKVTVSDIGTLLTDTSFGEFLSKCTINGNEFVLSEDYYEWCMPIYSAEAMIIDINADGTKDILIYGYVGVRSAAITYVCIAKDNDFTVNEVYGMVYDAVPGYMRVNESDYEGAGEIWCEADNIYSISTDGVIKSELSYYERIRYTDDAGNSVDPVCLESAYYGAEKETITAKEFDALRLKFSSIFPMLESEK